MGVGVSRLGGDSRQTIPSDPEERAHCGSRGPEEQRRHNHQLAPFHPGLLADPRVDVRMVGDRQPQGSLQISSPSTAHPGFGVSSLPRHLATFEKQTQAWSANQAF